MSTPQDKLKQKKTNPSGTVRKRIPSPNDMKVKVTSKMVPEPEAERQYRLKMKKDMERSDAQYQASLRRDEQQRAAEQRKVQRDVDGIKARNRNNPLSEYYTGPKQKAVEAREDADYESNKKFRNMNPDMYDSSLPGWTDKLSPRVQKKNKAELDGIRSSIKQRTAAANQRIDEAKKPLAQKVSNKVQNTFGVPLSDDPLNLRNK